LPNWKLMFEISHLVTMHLIFIFLDLNLKVSDNSENSEKFENYEDNLDN
jgi:hypothetical protein